MNISSRATSGGILSRLPSVSSGIGLKELTTPTSSAQQQQQAKKFRNSEINVSPSNPIIIHDTHTYTSYIYRGA